MTHLVETILFHLYQVASIVERIVLKEETDFVDRLIEIPVIQLRLFGRRKNTPHFIRVESLHQLQRPFPQNCAGFGGHEVLEDYDPRLLVGVEHLWRQFATRRR